MAVTIDETRGDMESSGIDDSIHGSLFGHLIHRTRPSDLPILDDHPAVLDDPIRAAGPDRGILYADGFLFGWLQSTIGTQWKGEHLERFNGLDVILVIAFLILRVSHSETRDSEFPE